MQGYENASESIFELAKSKELTTENFKKILTENIMNTEKIPDSLLNKVIDDLNNLKNLPTDYFEAKPQRAVGLDEVQAVVIPNDASAEFKQQLQDAGLQYYEYDPNIEGDRQRVINQFDDLKFSMSNENSDIAPIQGQGYDVYGRDVRTQVDEAIAPLLEEIQGLTEQVQTLQNTMGTAENIAPVSQEVAENEAMQNLQNINDSDIAPEIDVDNMSFEDAVSEALGNEDYSTTSEIQSPLESRDIDEVGNRQIKAYQYLNPEVRPFFQEAAQNMLYDLDNSIKGERSFNDQLYYESGGEKGFFGVTRATTDDIAYLLDNYNYTYDQIRKGLNAIIEDHGAENNAVSKRIEFMLDERLRKGYTMVDGHPMPPNQEYIDFLHDRNITEYNKEAFNALTDADAPTESITEEQKTTIEPKTLQVDESILPAEENAQNRNTELSDTGEETQQQEEIAKILTERPTQENRKQRLWAKFKANILDKGAVFEDLAIKTKNRELMGKWDYMLTSNARAQNVIGNGTYEFNPDTKTMEQVSKSLNDIREEVGNADKVQEFSEYLYHKHNIDRMNLESKAQAQMQELLDTTLKDYSNEEIENLARRRITEKTKPETADIIEAAKEYKQLSEVKNKPVFGDSVTSEVSQGIVDLYENNNPEFMDWAKDVYDYNNANLSQLVKSGVISQETADTFGEMYPHYVPIARVTTTGNAINVPLDTNRTSINTPIKRAKGGNQDILPLFDTMARRTQQTYRAVAKNNFGVELKNALKKGIVENTATNVEDVLENVDQQENLLQEGKNGQAPTFTVFENGDKVTYEITEDMYDALKPVSDSSILSTTFKPFNKISNIHRGVLTEYNPVFMLTNSIKDAQDVLMNSQHALKTYSKFPEAYAQILKEGYWYNEYVANGGESNSYFNSQEGTFDTGEPTGIKRFYPLRKISEINNIIEMAPRLAEYIASREAGRSIETSMLDAARVTTNFKAGGDVTKWANRNGATFLNASVQGLNQNIRNIREANMNGLKGWANLALKTMAAGVPAMLLNALLWDDDEDYQELSDYVKQNYYIIGKYGDGQFIRIPKGRTAAVIQDALNQAKNFVTGDDEVDLNSFLGLVVNNLAPNNPIDNNVIAPLIQAKNNTTWYGGDLVPTRLQDVPVAEQYDETTDAFSKWLGENLNISPMKINYILDQYSGGVGDIFLPMMTQQAESGTDSLAGKLVSPFVDKFTTDSTMKNRNTSDFYSLKEEVTTKANSLKATDEDILQNKYLNSVNADMSELYKQKREIQNDPTLSDSQKYNKVRKVQEQINAMAKEAKENYKNVSITDNYASIGGIDYYKKDDTWTKIKAEEAEELDDLGMDTEQKATYFDLKNEISDIKSSDSESKKAKVAKAVMDSNLTDEQKAYIYGKNYSSDETMGLVINSEIPFNEYLKFAAQNIEADKDSDGKSISGSKKSKVINYVNSLNLNIPQKAILIRREYSSFKEYNDEIVSYVNSLDLSYDDKVSILSELKMKVLSDGTVTW